eukprot:351776-Chlamydomonas_euryale.AAC.5
MILASPGAEITGGGSPTDLSLRSIGKVQPPNKRQSSSASSFARVHSAIRERIRRGMPPISAQPKKGMQPSGHILRQTKGDPAGLPNS